MNKLTPQVKRVIWSGILGNSLELYDYTLYGFFAAIIALQFFPSNDPYAALLATYGVYSSGFIFRPIGAILFGYIGDRYGRKKALEISILLMAIPTLAMGLLPGYKVLGLLAPMLLTALRMMQGVSVGGELVGSYSFLIEHAPESRKGYVGSWTLVGNFGGKLLGSLAAGGMALLVSQNSLEEWGWRLPFLFGLVFAVVGYYLRKHVSETPVFLELKDQGRIEQQPVREVLKSAKMQILKMIGCLVVHTVAVHMIFIYLPVYFKTELHITYSQALFSNIVALVIMMILIPISGQLSDRIGRKPLPLYGTIVLTAITYPAFKLMSTGSFPLILGMHCLISVVFAFMHGPIPALFLELFKPSIRYTGASIGYNVGVAIFGGFSPLIATWLIMKFGTPIAPAYWLIASGLISTVTVLFIKETRPVSQPKEELCYD